jgi:hypothetical protein
MAAIGLPRFAPFDCSNNNSGAVRRHKNDVGIFYASCALVIFPRALRCRLQESPKVRKILFDIIGKNLSLGQLLTDCLIIITSQILFLKLRQIRKFSTGLSYSFNGSHFGNSFTTYVIMLQRIYF